MFEKGKVKIISRIFIATIGSIILFLKGGECSVPLPIKGETAITVAQAMDNELEEFEEKKEEKSPTECSNSERVLIMNTLLMGGYFCSAFNFINFHWRINI